ncbi:MAG TPA: precorrin-8X methylmutase, partial [Polyangiaceae bacterium]|nr:precorrin-8X methylmutase [Polyangiaceae bacterium]
HRLSHKFGVLLDSAGGLGDLHLDVRVDLRVDREAGSNVRAYLGVATGPASSMWLGFCRPEDVPGAAVRLTNVLAEQAPGRRMRELVRQSGVVALREQIGSLLVGLAAPAVSAPAAPNLWVGHHDEQSDWLGIGLAFGSGDARQWQRIAELAERFGTREVRLTPFRSVILPGVAREQLWVTTPLLHETGLIFDPADPLLRAVACTGAPHCPSARGETRTLARQLSRSLLPRLAPQARLHVSGCSKSCAHSGAAEVALAYSESGCRAGFDKSVAELASEPEETVSAACERLGALARGPLQMTEHVDSAKGRRHGAGSMTRRYEYEREGAAIYARSFATIRAEAELGRFSAVEERVVVRLVHTSGMVELARDIEFSPDFAAAARQALERGAPILCDAKMILAGVTRRRLRASNELVCCLDEPSVPALALEQRTTRSAAALTLWGERLQGALVVIGNAPTALFRLLELFDESPLRPAAVIGVPVGFVGAAESKAALLADGRVPCMIVRGRKGGSAMAVAAINALATDEE